MEYTIEDLENELHEDLNIAVTGLRCTDSQLDVALECDDWRGDARRLSFLIQCREVAEWQPFRSSLKGLRISDDHPLLWAHNSDHAYLHFASSPGNAFELSGLLREGIQRLYGYYDPPSGCRPATASILAAGSGLIARGPMPVIQELERIARPIVRCSVLPAQRAPEKKRKLFEVDGCYAVCESVTIAEWTAI